MFWFSTSPLLVILSLPAGKNAIKIYILQSFYLFSDLIIYISAELSSNKST